MASSRKGAPVAVLDLGSSKVCCLIAERLGGAHTGDSLEAYRFLGLGHRRSQGIKSGVIVDLDAAEQAVRAAVAEAEHAAGTQIEAVHVAITSGRLKSLNFKAEADLARGIVGVDDLTRLWEGAREYVSRTGRSIISLNEVAYRLDGCDGIADPRGLAGRQIVADIHAVTADAPPLRNVQALLRRCFLELAGFVPAAFASAMAATTEEERQAGVTCIDIGGGVTGVAVLSHGRFLHTGSIPFGASHISLDIARDLAISFDEAERIKTLHGSVLHATSDETEIVGYDARWAEQTVRQQTVRAHVRQIVEHRLRMLLQLVGEHLAQSPMSAFGKDRIVLTGGGAQLLGLAEFAANTLSYPVRIGGPANPGFGPERLAGPGFSTLIGMLNASSGANHLLSGGIGLESSAEGPLGRVGRWLRESF